MRGALAVVLLLVCLRDTESGLWGWDFGSENLVAAGVLPNSVEVVLNSMSQRRTPCRVILGHEKHRRLLGEECLSERRGLAFNDLLALLFGDEEARGNDEHFKVTVPFEPVEQSAGFLRENNATQIAAMLLAHTLKQDSSGRVGGVCTAPVSATWHQKAALLDALFIAGVGEGQIVDSGSCVAAYYGLLKLGGQTLLHNVKDPLCLLVDVGYSSLSASLCRFSCEEDRILGARVLSQRSSKHCSTKLLDEGVSRLIQKDLLKHKHRFSGGEMSQRLLSRIQKAANKAKTVLSANLEASWDIECAFSDGGDARGIISRAELETETAAIEETAAQLCQEVLNEGLQRIKEEGGDPKSFAVSLESGIGFEVVGGGAAVPMIKRGLERGVQFAVERHGINADVTPGRSMNPFEAPALGAALLAAINSGRISRGSRLRRFELEGVLQNRIELELTAYFGKEIRHGVVTIKNGAKYPSETRIVAKFDRSEEASEATERWEVQLRAKDVPIASKSSVFCWSSQFDPPEEWKIEIPASIELSFDMELDSSSFPRLASASLFDANKEVPLKMQLCEVPFHFAPYPGVNEEVENRQLQNLRLARDLETQWVLAEAAASAAENARNEVEALLYEVQGEIRDSDDSPLTIFERLVSSRAEETDVDAVERIRVACEQLALNKQKAFLSPLLHKQVSAEHLDSFSELSIAHFLSLNEKEKLWETLQAVERDLDDFLPASEWENRKLSIETTRILARGRKLQWDSALRRISVVLEIVTAVKVLLEEDWDASVRITLEDVRKSAVKIAEDVETALREPWKVPTPEMLSLEELQQLDLFSLLEKLRKEQST